MKINHEREKSHLALLMIAICIVLLPNLSGKLQYSGVTPVENHTQIASVEETCKPVVTHNLALKRRCGIPDSIEWGDYRIFLYDSGYNAEMARLDRRIKHRRDSVKIARGL